MVYLGGVPCHEMSLVNSNDSPVNDSLLCLGEMIVKEQVKSDHRFANRRVKIHCGGSAKTPIHQGQQLGQRLHIHSTLILYHDY